MLKNALLPITCTIMICLSFSCSLTDHDNTPAAGNKDIISRNNSDSAMFSGIDGAATASNIVTFPVQERIMPPKYEADMSFAYSNIDIQPQPNLEAYFSTTDPADIGVHLYFPYGAGSGPHPLVLIVPGGAFVNCQAENNKTRAQKFAENGYIAAILEYRTWESIEAVPVNVKPYAAQIGSYWVMQDIRAAVDYLVGLSNDFAAREDYKGFLIDADNIFLYGTSAGAISVLMAGHMDKSEFNSYAENIPLFTQLYGDIDARVRNRYKGIEFDGFVRGVASKAGGFSLNPSYFFDSDDTVPVIMGHNINDNVVPYLYDDNVLNIGAKIWGSGWINWT